MGLKLYSFPGSACGQRVAVVLNEKGIPFEFKLVDFAAGDIKTPEFLEKQPFGQVPYIDDDGFVLYEFRAIARYIESKYPGKGIKLAPSPEDDLKTHALFDQALSVETHKFSAPAAAAVFEKMFKPFFGGVTDEAIYESHMKILDSRLAVYDQILSKQSYVAGEELTMVDLFHLPHGHLLGKVGSDIMTKYPNVARWWKEISVRPSWTSIADGIKGKAVE